MKPKAQRSGPSNRQSNALALPRPGVGNATIPVWRRRLYRIAALLLAPALLFGVAELALRIAGRGYPATFLVRRSVEGEEVLVENASFGRLFFPSPLARSPAPTRIAARKPPGTFRILLFGESAALGDPRLAYGMGRYLEVLLQERYPQPRFEVVPIAMTAINSHALRLMASESRRYEGDVWVVYAGNNEMVGPFGAATVFGPRAPSLAFVRAVLALKSTRTGQALASLVERRSAGPATNSPWSGLKMFLQNQLPPDDPGRQRVFDHFEQNLEAIVRSGLRSGAPVILSTVAVNLRDCAPFASLHRSTVSSEALADFARWYHVGQTNQATGQWSAACEAYAQAAAIDPRYAELQFVQGECLARSGRTAEARAALEQACEDDALPFRATPSLNAIVRQVAARHRPERVTLVDSAGQLAAAGAGGIPGRELFFEHAHPNFQGNYLLARGLAEAIAPLLADDVRQNAKPDWASAEICDQWLGLTDWNRSAVIDVVLKRIADAPYTNQLTSAMDRQELHRQLVGLRTRMTPDQYTNTFALYRQAVGRRTNDFRLHENFAEFLEAVNQVPAALAHWGIVRELVPHHFAPYVHLGRLLSRLGKWEDARRHLETGLRLEPRSVEAHLELAQVLTRQDDWPAAAAEYELALRLQPANARAHVQLADVLARQGQRAAATEALRQAVRVDPSLWEAHYLLGVELAMTAALAEAQAEFEAAVRLNPDHALSRLNLGVALIRQGRAYEAKRQFGETLRIDPHNEKAKRYLETVDEMIGKSQPAAQPPAPSR